MKTPSSEEEKRFLRAVAHLGGLLEKEGIYVEDWNNSGEVAEKVDLAIRKILYEIK